MAGLKKFDDLVGMLGAGAVFLGVIVFVMAPFIMVPAIFAQRSPNLPPLTVMTLSPLQKRLETEDSIAPEPVAVKRITSCEV